MRGWEELELEIEVLWGGFRDLLVFKAYAHQVMVRLGDSILAIGTFLKSLVNPLLIWL